jgi:cytochrome c553
VAGLPKPIARPSAGADLHNGNNLYQGKCGACHGTRAEGNVSLSTPRLAGLDAAYLRRQYQNFGSGVRGAHPQDRYGKQMVAMSKSLASPKDLDDVIAYIQATGARK